VSTRGEYRSTYVSIWDDDEYLDLSMGAKMVHRYLRDTNGPLGVGRLSHVQAAAAIGCSRAELATALEELERPTARRPHGWIVREGLHVWVVAALAEEPNLQARNPKHQEYIRRLLRESDAPTALLERVRAHYAEWVPVRSQEPTGTPADASGDGTDTLSDTLSNGYRMGTDTQETRDRSPETDPSRSVGDLGESPARVREAGAAADRPTEGGARAGTATASGRADPPGVPPLAGELALPNVAAWLRRFYGASSPERRADVEQQLLAMLTPDGAPTPEGKPAACSLEELDAQCEDMLAAVRQPRHPERAIVFLLRNVATGRKPQRIARRDTERARLLGRPERRQAAASATLGIGDDSRERTEATQAQVRARVAAWAAEHPDEHARLQSLADAAVPRTIGPPRRAVLVEARLEGLVLEQLRDAEAAAQPAGSGT
jgi:hypothetical protein